MKIALSAIVVMIGAHMLISILDSNMMKTIETRNEKLCQMNQSFCKE